LHRELARRADLEGVSLNQFALSALSRCVGAC
jgi:predicted HicB family RNase H-like nuclease